MDASTLFNCCTDHAEPDWSQYDALELGGCISIRCDETGEEEFVEGGYDRHEAEFFTVYGHLKEGGCEDITDLANFALGEAVLDHLGELSGLPTTILC